MGDSLTGGEPRRSGFRKQAILRAGTRVGPVNLAPHLLRTAFATLHVEAGTPLPEVQKMLEHSDITTTMRYVEDSTAGLREAQAKVAEARGLGVSSKSARKSAVSRKAKPGLNPGIAKKRKKQAK